MTKYKYYFRKPRSEIVNDILLWLFIAGAISIAATSPYFGINAWRAFQKAIRRKKYPKRKFSDTFTRLQRKRVLFVERSGHEVKIFLTPEGRKLAGYMQIDSLAIKKPARWDKKWRIVLFDIDQLKSTHRNAFRSKLKELGFVLFQKSVWLHAFDCRDEIELLKDFFGLTNKEVCLITTKNIPMENSYKKHFNI
jgi:hypothetical protein